ncbi:22180_t:CDS:1 [Racocetra persica]|uniref:22180_t:CDS:1 n=1 Tax=Racocetra persica TaxID=160502 RepID=A0ACA9MAA2_9GLOM|nr:22180_t:CDS:1 [Racocetra persica]
MKFKNQTPKTLSTELEIKRLKQELKRDNYMKNLKIKENGGFRFKINQTPESFKNELEIKRINPNNYQLKNYQHKFRPGIKRSNSLSSKLNRCNIPIPSLSCTISSREAMQQTINLPQILPQTVEDTKENSYMQPSGKNYVNASLHSNRNVIPELFDTSQDFSRSTQLKLREMYSNYLSK